jgi:RNA polymerase sigma factor for flagellar operon FliA
MYTASGKSDKNSILTEHAPLVKRLAYQLKARLPPSVEVDDLIQAGMIGLLDAVNRYEDNHGAQFETYAIQRIRGSMLDELRSSDWLPRGVRQTMRKIENAMNELQQRLGRPPMETEVAKHLKLDLNSYQELLGESGGHQLLYYEDFHDSDTKEHFLDHFYSDDRSGDPLQDLLHGDFRDAVVYAINSLPEREKLLMGLYYEQELNLKEIGAVMGVSESRVSQLHSQAVARLRVSLRERAWTGLA